MLKSEIELRQLMAEGKVPATAGITPEGEAAIRFECGKTLILRDVEWGPFLETEGEIAASAAFARLVVVAGLASKGEALSAVRSIPPDWVGDVFPNPLKGGQWRKDG